MPQNEDVPSTIFLLVFFLGFIFAWPHLVNDSWLYWSNLSRPVGRNSKHKKIIESKGHAVIWVENWRSLGFAKMYLSIIKSLAARLAVGYGVDVTHLSLFLLGRYYYCYPAPFIFANSLCAINSKEEEEKKTQFPAFFSNNGFWPAPHWLGFPLTHASRPMSKFVRLF